MYFRSFFVCILFFKEGGEGIPKVWVIVSEGDINFPGGGRGVGRRNIKKYRIVTKHPPAPSTIGEISLNYISL